MSMLDWKEYHRQVLSGVGEIGRISPDIMKGYQTLGGAAGKTGLLGAKVNELIALAVAVTVRCDGCIAVHTAAAIRAGAGCVRAGVNARGRGGHRFAVARNHDPSARAIFRF